MITFFNHKHVLHQVRQEVFRGQMLSCFGLPARADHVLSELTVRQLGPVPASGASETDPISGILLKSSGFCLVDDDIADAAVPAVFTFEGGHVVAQLGANAVNILESFERRAA